MLTIRFARVGKRNKAQFKIVLQERAVAPGGRHVEILGSYDPHLKQAVLKEEKIKYWLGKGAHLSDTVYNLLVSKNVISGKKRVVKMPTKKVEETKTEEKAVEKPKEPVSPVGKEAKPEAKSEKEPKAEVKPEEKPKEEAPKKEAKASSKEAKK